MLSDHQTIPYVTAKPQAAVLPAAADARDWKYCTLLVAVLSLLYLILQNGYWVSGPDVALYISVARSLVQGHGFLSNGCAVGNITPGWPMVLAAVMKLSPSFAILNLVPMICLVASAAIWYWVLRRLTSPGRALAIILLSGTLFWTYSASNQLRTEALFCLCLSAAALLACQMAEGRGFWIRLLPLLVLCIAMVTVRWAGLAAWSVIGAALAARQRRLDWNRAWVCVALTLAITYGAFLGNKHLVKNVLRPADALSPALDSDLDDSDEALPPMIPKNWATYYVKQLLGAGQWITGLFWMPSSIADSIPVLGVVTDVAGWGLLVVLGVYLIRLAREQQYLLVGAVLYSAAIVMRWGRAEPRYLMPVVPLLIGGVWLGLDHLAAIARVHWQSKLARLAGVFLVASIALGSAVVFGIDAYIARSGRFYHLYLGGELEDLISSAAYLNTQHLGNSDIAVSAQYLNMGQKKGRSNGFGRRGIALLTDRVVRVPKGKWNKSAAGRPDKQIINWANSRGIKYYVYRPEVSPWRAWHFRVPWLQRLLTHKPVIENAGWELYRIEPGRAVRMPLTPFPDWPQWLERLKTHKGVSVNTGWEAYHFVEPGRAVKVPLTPTPGWPHRVPGL